MTDYTVIDDRDGFLAGVAALATGTGPVAVDVERASGFRYSQRAYLVQVFRRGAGVFMFDPPAIGDMHELQDAIGDLEWVLHAASQDLPSLRELGLEPTRMFDTELASRLLGHERVGLGAVVEDTLGISLEKAHSAADWSTRPLPQAWLEYAALDVLHLVDVRDALQLEVDAQEKQRIVDEEFDAVLSRPPKPPRDDPWRSLSGLHAVRGRTSLAVARELWTARDEFARAEDVSPGRLVPDRSLVAAVIANPQSKRDLAALKEFTGRASRTQLDRWWDAIERGRASTDLPLERVPSGALPPPRTWAERNPEAFERFRESRSVVVAIAGELGMPSENLLTPEHLRRLSWEPPAPLDTAGVGAALAGLGARPWQIDATAERIAAAFVASVTASSEPADAAS